MKAPSLQLRREDYPDFEGERLDRFLRQLTTFGTQTYAALNRGLTFGENLAAQTKEITVKTLEDWVVPTMAVGWANYGAGLAGVAYRKDAAGQVHLRGAVSGGTIGTAVFTLPVGFRPYGGVVFAVNSDGAYGAAHVTAAGEVIAAVGTNTQFMLDGVSFRAADTQPVRNPCFPISVDVSLPGNRKPEFVIAKVLDTETGTPIAIGLPAWSASVSASSGAYVLKLHDIPGLTPARTYKLTLLVIGG
jgi:hypothetical protein